MPTSAPPSATDSCALSARATFNNWSTDGSGRWLRRRLIERLAPYERPSPTPFLPNWWVVHHCHDVNLPKAVKRKRPVVAPDDVAKLADAMDSRYMPMVWVGALLGLRWGEVAGLRIRSLDLLAATLTVTETITRDEHGRPFLGPPKSEAGLRTLSMPQVLVNILAGHLARMGLTGADAERLVFPAPSSNRWSYATYRRRIWQPATSKVGLDGVRFHDLRRTATTQLVLANVDLKTAGTRLGHSDPRLTLAVYAQATSEADKAAADLVGERFAAAMGFGNLDRISTEASSTPIDRSLNPGWGYPQNRDQGQCGLSWEYVHGDTLRNRGLRPHDLDRISTGMSKVRTNKRWNSLRTSLQSGPRLRLVGPSPLAMIASPCPCARWSGSERFESCRGHTAMSRGAGRTGPAPLPRARTGSVAWEPYLERGGLLTWWFRRCC